MSESSNERAGIADEDLPADLQPTDDNPLAQDLDPDEAKSPEELDVLGGKAPEQDSQQDSQQDSPGDDSGA